ncbi:MAG: DUF2254 domain-containing protein [Thermodesulfobacteriota bacterium]
MNTRLRKIWDTLRSSLWFVPAVMSVGAVALAIVMVAVDRMWGADAFAKLDVVYGGGADGAREVLSAIASSMITVAGVTFSITIVALTLAAQQYGPRLLGSFLRDTGNQVVLETFVATFLYCLLVLRTIRGGDGGSFVPQLSVTVGVVLALGSLAILIYFIHHVSMSIQASYVIAAVGKDLAGAIDRLFPDRIGNEQRDERPPPDALPEEWAQVGVIGTGYVQAIDGDELIALAEQRDLLVRLQCHPGDFVTDGTPIASVAPPKRVDDAVERGLRRVVIVGRERTIFQDVGFAIDQLVEVALRALSPSINDPFTAASCIDHLGAGLCRLAGRAIPSPYRYHDGRLRVIAPRFEVADAIARAFDQIREAARRNTAVMVRLLKTLRDVGAAVRGVDARAAVLRQAEMVERASRQSIDVEGDRERLAEEYRAVLAELSWGS